MDNKFTQEQAEIIHCPSDKIQVIAGPGSGKTRTLVGKVVDLVKNGMPPKGIVVFTFTSKAADELNNRIKEELENEGVYDGRISELYIGTIHGFCLFILQDIVNIFRGFDILTPIRNKIFVDKNFISIGVHRVKKQDTCEPMKVYTDTDKFLQLIETINENEVNWPLVPKEIIDAYQKYKEMLIEERHFTFTSILSRAYKELGSNMQLRNYIANNIKYLIVDEYQDVNFIQEKIISQIHSLGSKLFVVGDLDQNIYSWRGSDVDNFLYFDKRYKGVTKFFLSKNFRSTQAVVDIANRIIKNNKKRDQSLTIITDNNGYNKGDCIYMEFNEPSAEAEFIVNRMEKLNERLQIPYSEMALLVRTNKLSNDIIKAMETRNVPYHVRGVNKLFIAKEIRAAIAIFQYICRDITSDSLENLWISAIPTIKLSKVKEGVEFLNTLHLESNNVNEPLLIQRVYWDFLGTLDIFNGKDPFDINREKVLCNLGKFSQVIHDYESMNFNDIPKTKFLNFCRFIEVSAKYYYPEGYIDNPYMQSDGVNIMTIHQAKGLEFTAVFIPGLSDNLFPHQKIGGLNIWSYLPDSCINEPYKLKGGDEEAERRLFYVAITRSTKFLTLTRSVYSQNTAKPSIFLYDALQSNFIEEYKSDRDAYVSTPNFTSFSKKPPAMRLSFSKLSDYYECPFRFKLSNFYGFVQCIDDKINYGSSMHSIVCDINKAYASGVYLSEQELIALAKRSLYLPYIDRNTRIYDNLEKRCINSTIQYYKTLLKNCNFSIEFVEQKIEIPIDDTILLEGRIDLVKKVNTEDMNTRVIIVDFKTHNQLQDNYTTVNDKILKQLSIYCLGYEHITGNKTDYIQLHNLNNNSVIELQVSEESLLSTINEIKNAADIIHNNKFSKKISKEKCERCLMRRICISSDEAIRHHIYQ